jgi:epoxyqueuosine reductase QueG
MSDWTPDSLAERLMDYARMMGAVSAGVATLETLEGGPPSTDLTYVLPEAKSAVSFAVPIDQSAIDPYLSKEDRHAQESDARQANIISSGIACWLANFLEQKGFKAKAINANQNYRDKCGDEQLGKNPMNPEISHRYVAAASGVGFFGLSGNILTKDNGGAVILGTCVTSAELTPTKPIPQEENYCDNCGLCLDSCLSGMMDQEEKAAVTIGGTPFSYSKRREYMRCGFVCGGLSGLHPDKKWSTWSPGRYKIPYKDEDFIGLVLNTIPYYSKRPEMSGGNYNVLTNSKIYTTCANCQLLCHPDKKKRADRFKMLTTNGVIIQHPDGSLERVTPEKAEEHMAAMDEETRALYQ